MATKKMNVPDIGNLLSTITKKRESGELPPTDIQRVQSVEADAPKVHAEKAQQGVKTPKQQNPSAQEVGRRGPGGRPSAKEQGVEYARLSSRIPKALKKRGEIALTEERFQDAKGRPITTFDELVTFALERLVPEKK